MITFQNKIVILFTFATGLFVGGYLYLTGFATTFEPPEADEKDIYTEFVITAESYGTCSNDGTCLSFQVLENGSYRAVLNSKPEKRTKEAKIPYVLRKNLYSTLTSSSLEKIKEKGGVSVCHYEGTNYRFKITRNQIEYIIDTCTSAISYGGTEWKTLAKLWNYMSNLKW